MFGGFDGQETLNTTSTIDFTEPLKICKPDRSGGASAPHRGHTRAQLAGEETIAAEPVETRLMPDAANSGQSNAIVPEAWYWLPWQISKRLLGGGIFASLVPRQIDSLTQATLAGPNSKTDSTQPQPAVCQSAIPQTQQSGYQPTKASSTIF